MTKMPKKYRGFTLVELMITVAIIAILAAVALPSYQQYVIRGNRAAAQAEMMEIANREQQYFLANRQYADQATLGYTLSSKVAANYTFTFNPDVNNAATPPSFTIYFTATGSQASDGDLQLSSTGVKAPSGKW